MRYANIYIYIFVLHRGFFQQPRGRVAPRLGPAPQLGRQIADYIFHKNDFRFYLSYFIFMFQPIDYQLFRKMKHNTSMFHF